MRSVGPTLVPAAALFSSARVLADEPRLLLIDEPNEGLAPMIVDEMFALMAGPAKDRIAIVLVGQNVKRAVELATRFYVIEHGQVVMQGRATEPANRTALFEPIAA